MEQVRSRKVDIVVVYKVDRLTLSLANFAKLVELFDAHEVSFVSVTQSFNTTSSMGRLTLNVLLSFAQFEREVIDERVRDKISASKHKGIRVGGPIPLGYRSVDKKLEIVPQEAAVVRLIFETYRTLGSIPKLAAHRDATGIRPKPRRLADGRTIAAQRYRVGPLAHMLKNRFYVGEVVYRDEANQGEHEPILDRELFEAVQCKLRERAVERTTKRSNSSSVLLGLIYDDFGNPMSPSHANKKGVRYRYYVSHAVTQGRGDLAGSMRRVSTPDVEELLCVGVRSRLGEPREQSDRDTIRNDVERVVIHPTHIRVTLKAPPNDDGGDSEVAPKIQPTVVTIPFTPTTRPRKGIAHEPGELGMIDPKTQETLLRAIARARRWMDAILAGQSKSFEEIAAAENDAALVRRIFEAYLEEGSIPKLAARLDREGVRPRARMLSNGKTVAAERFMVGPLAHMLRNRFYVGEVVYKGETHPGEHEPIVQPETFDHVQQRLAD